VSFNEKTPLDVRHPPKQQDNHEQATNNACKQALRPRVVQRKIAAVNAPFKPSSPGLPELCPLKWDGQSRWITQSLPV
jgi:hypothetical protein